MNSIALSPISITQAVSDFQKLYSRHENVKVALKSIGMEMHAISSPQVILLTGPTKVGKSKLVEIAHDEVMAIYRERLHQERNFVPIVAINAVPPSGNEFSLKDFFTRLLNAQNEPLVSHKLQMFTQLSLLPELPRVDRQIEYSSTDALRRSTEQYMRLRNTKLLIVDNAHYMLLTTKGTKLECIFESLKSLAAESGATILLVGTYRLLEILNQGPQLTCQCQIVHLPRYDKTNAADQEHFAKVLDEFEQYLQKYVKANLSELCDYFYTKSIGCIGILKDWLSRCLEHALWENAPRIDQDYADRFAPSNRSLVAILEEIDWAETQLMDIDISQVTNLVDGIVMTTKEIAPPRSNRKPGKRNPVRDPVGLVLP